MSPVTRIRQIDDGTLLAIARKRICYKKPLKNIPILMAGNFAETQIIESGKVFSHCSFITYIFFILFLLTAPLNLYGFGLQAFNLRFSRIFLVLTVLSLLFDYIIRIRSIPIRLKPFDYMLVLYCSLALLSGLYVEDYASFFKRFFALLECMLILYVVRFLTYENGMFRIAVRFYLLSSIFVILGACYQLYSLWSNLGGLALPFPSLLLTERYETLTELEHFGGSLGGFLRTSSTFGEPNMMAGYCSSIIPFAMAMFLAESGKRERVLAFMYAFLGIGIGVTMMSAVSKSGIISTVIAIIIFIFMIFKTVNMRQKQKMVLLMVLILFSIGIYAFYAKDFILLRFGLVDSGHLEYRMEAMEDFIEGSLLGTGYGNYKYVSAHTLILTALLELGPFGALVVFLLSTQPIFYFHLKKHLLLISKRNQAARVHYYFYGAAFAAYISILVGLYLYDYWLHPFAWISIGLFLSIISRVQDGLFDRYFREL